MSKTWEEMSELEQMACTYSDMYKDAYGVRPRGVDTSTWTAQDFRAEFELLQSIIDENFRRMNRLETQAAHDVELRILKLQELGARDRAQAIRWLHDAYETAGDEDYLCYRLGLPYGYFKTAV
jgi:hypothetical protein